MTCPPVRSPTHRENLPLSLFLSFSLSKRNQKKNLPWKKNPPKNAKSTSKDLPWISTAHALHTHAHAHAHTHSYAHARAHTILLLDALQLQRGGRRGAGPALGLSVLRDGAEGGGVEGDGGCVSEHGDHGVGLEARLVVRVCAGDDAEEEVDAAGERGGRGGCAADGRVGRGGEVAACGVEAAAGGTVTTAEAARAAGALNLRFRDGAVAVQVDGSAKPEAKVERTPRRAYPDKPEQPRLI